MDPETPAGKLERAALEWLERQDAPQILADSNELAGRRTVVPVFVPVNDAAQVSEVDRSKLDEAECLLAVAADPKSKAKAEALALKLAAKLKDDTARVIAVPAKLGKDLRAGLALLPEYRGRQERRFPCATPANSRFAFVWSDAVPSSETLENLVKLLDRLVRLGHSSSLVLARPASEAELLELRQTTRTYRPDLERGDLVIRWVGPGQVDRLVQAFGLHKETETRVLPAHFVRYSDEEVGARPASTHSTFSDDFLVFARTQGPRLPMTAGVGLARLLRRALMSVADQPVDSLISGHKPDGAPTEEPHLAVVPLPLVSGPYPNGSLLGIALVLPRDCSETSRRAVLRAVGRLEKPVDDLKAIKLNLGQAGELELERLIWGDSLQTLRSGNWCMPSSCWATATPIALDRNPGDLHDPDPSKRREAYRQASEILVQALARIGLPAPEEIEVLRSCVLPGTAKPRNFPRFPPEPSRPQRVLVHASFYFHDLVAGPLLVGAGRYHGLGLCLPVDPGGVH